MNQKIILASQSPRRRVLLEMMGVHFSVQPSNFEEYFDDQRSVEEVVKELGLGKALDVAKDYPNDIVIGGDIIVVLDGKQLGKPSDEAEARSMLQAFSGRSHELIASVAVVCLAEGYKKVAVEHSTVTFKPFTKEFIDAYVATKSMYDKAGGYAIQHPLVRPFVANIQGRIDTIIGMPTNLVAAFLQDFDIQSRQLELKHDDLTAKEFFD